MIRHDYILQMIEEFARALAKISSLKKGQRWNEASTVLDEEFKRLIGEGPQAVASRSETELLAKLTHDAPTHAVRDKTLILTALLKEAGDLAAAEDRLEESRECYMKALHLLLLDTLASGDVFESPQFVPKIELLKNSLEGAPLPVRTHAMLMQHYERIAEFSKAEDALYAMLDSEPDNDRIVEFGVAFYHRLLGQKDLALANGNLPRAEVEEGLKKLEARRK